MNEDFEINVELSPEVRISKRLEHDIEERVIQKLRKVNLEYLDMSTHLGVRAARPHVVLRMYQDPQYFRPGLKPRYSPRKTKPDIHGIMNAWKSALKNAFSSSNISERRRSC